MKPPKTNKQTEIKLSASILPLSNRINEIIQNNLLRYVVPLMCVVYKGAKWWRDNSGGIRRKKSAFNANLNDTMPLMVMLMTVWGRSSTTQCQPHYRLLQGVKMFWSIPIRIPPPNLILSDVFTPLSFVSREEDAKPR